jgi:hypothetical protein
MAATAKFLSVKRCTLCRHKLIKDMFGLDVCSNPECVPQINRIRQIIKLGEGGPCPECGGEMEESAWDTEWVDNHDVPHFEQWPTLECENSGCGYTLLLDDEKKPTRYKEYWPNLSKGHPDIDLKNYPEAKRWKRLI